MGLFDNIVGSLFGGGGGSQGALGSIVGSILAGQGSGGATGGAGAGLGGLVEKFNQAGLGNVIGSWIGNGPNQSITPDALGRVLNQEQVGQWAQQAGMSQDGLLASLSKMLPHAVDQATPNGQLPAQAGGSAFDGAGMELPPR